MPRHGLLGNGQPRLIIRIGEKSARTTHDKFATSGVTCAKVCPFFPLSSTTQFVVTPQAATGCTPPTIFGSPSITLNGSTGDFLNFTANNFSGNVSNIQINTTTGATGAVVAGPLTVAGPGMFSVRVTLLPGLVPGSSFLLILTNPGTSATGQACTASATGTVSAATGCPRLVRATLSSTNVITLVGTGLTASNITTDTGMTFTFASTATGATLTFPSAVTLPASVTLAASPGCTGATVAVAGTTCCPTLTGATLTSPTTITLTGTGLMASNITTTSPMTFTFASTATGATLTFPSPLTPPVSVTLAATPGCPGTTLPVTGFACPTVTGTATFDPATGTVSITGTGFNTAGPILVVANNGTTGTTTSVPGVPDFSGTLLTAVFPPGTISPGDVVALTLVSNNGACVVPVPLSTCIPVIGPATATPDLAGNVTITATGLTAGTIVRVIGGPNNGAPVGFFDEKTGTFFVPAAQAPPGTAAFLLTNSTACPGVVATIACAFQGVISVNPVDGAGFVLVSSSVGANLAGQTVVLEVINPGGTTTSVFAYLVGANGIVNLTTPLNAPAGAYTLPPPADTPISVGQLQPRFPSCPGAAFLPVINGGPVTPLQGASTIKQDTSTTAVSASAVSGKPSTFTV